VTPPAVADLLGVSGFAADRLLEQLVRQGLLITCAGDADGEGPAYRLPRVLFAYAGELAAEDAEDERGFEGDGEPGPTRLKRGAARRRAVVESGR
jgi:hypothetical protein